MTGPGDLRLDPGRTIRAAAGIGLAVLGISLLPDLLTPNEPEPLPADVGFRPGENLAPTAIPMPSPISSTESGAGRPRSEEVGGPFRGRRGTPESKGDRGRKRKGGRPVRGRPRRAESTSEEPAGPPPAQSPPRPPVPVWTPPPAPPPPPPAPVGDGSIEFAPR